MPKNSIRVVCVNGNHPRSYIGGGQGGGGGGHVMHPSQRSLSKLCLASKCYTIRPFPSFCEPHYESEAKCEDFVMEISFHSYANKPNFHMESFARSLAFIVRFTATRKWPIDPILSM